MGIENKRKHKMNPVLFLSIVLLCCTVLEGNVRAAGTVHTDIINTTVSGYGETVQNEMELDEFAQEVMDMTKAYEPDADKDEEFRTMRLIVESSVPLCDETAEEIAGSYENLYVLQYDSIQKAEAAYDRLTQTDGVTAVQPDHTVDVMDVIEQTEQVPEKTYLAWGASETGIDTFTTFLRTEYNELPEITVAVLDTGVDSGVSMFKGRICEGGRNFVSSRKYNNADDDNGHGTMVCSVLADNTTDNVKILPIKVMNSNGEGYDSRIVLGMAYALDSGADIINMSIGGDAEMSIYRSMMQRAWKEGVPVVAAAGNEGTDVSTCTPANIESAVTVTSIDEQGNLSSFSNYGATVDFAAPGENIRVTGMKARRYIVSGTSFATPYVSAAYALLLTADTEQTAENIYELLKGYAQDLGERGWDSSYGYGKLNLKGIEEEYKGKDVVIAGDVDGDKCLTSVDAYYILCFITGSLEPDGEQWDNSDVDGDGAVTVLDVWHILKHETYNLADE